MKLKSVLTNQNVQFTENGLPGQNAVELVVPVFVPDRLVRSMPIQLPMISDYTKLELVIMKTVVSFFSCIGGHTLVVHRQQILKNFTIINFL